MEKDALTKFLWVCLGGAVGTGARYLVSGLAPRLLGATFPYGTLLVNVAGSSCIGALMHVGLATELLSPNARLTLAVGVLGGFTTYSSFTYETFAYLEEGAYGAASLYAGLTFVVLPRGAACSASRSRAGASEPDTPSRGRSQIPALRAEVKTNAGR
jgi:fluoride exporter